jgi:hypothetical protein
MKLMVIPVGRSLVFELQLSQTLRPILKRFAGRLARYANIDILKTSSAEEENILGNLALSLQRRKRIFWPPNSTLSLPFPGMTNTLYTIPTSSKSPRGEKLPPKSTPVWSKSA